MGGNNQRCEQGGLSESYCTRSERQMEKIHPGPPPKPPSQSNQQIVEIFEDTPAFAGLRGTDRA